MVTKHQGSQKRKIQRSDEQLNSYISRNGESYTKDQQRRANN